MSEQVKPDGYKAYKQLMYCFIVFSFFLKYLTNAQYMITGMDFTIVDPIEDGRQRKSHRRQRYIRDASGV